MIVGGGTGGHVFPALAVAEEVRARSRQNQVAFIGLETGLEARVVPQAGFPLYTIEAARFLGVGFNAKLRSLWLLARSARSCQRLFDEFRPDVVLSVGGYVSAPAALTAVLTKRRTVLFELNAEPGLAIRALAPLATRVAVAYEPTLRHFNGRAVRTGSPVRADFLRLAPKQHTAPFTLLIFGGSQGAVPINAAVVDALDRLRAAPYEICFIHQTGERDYNAVRTAYARRGIGADVRPFIEDMPACFARADLLICRSGASTVAELAAAAKAAILVPFPHAARHQLRNAELLARAGAARLVEQHDLAGERLAAEVSRLLAYPQEIQAMEERVRGLAVPDAAARLADLLESVTR